ncbi:nucleoside 2-deoxyribosyltransferase domain-containing protein [Sorangium sp. So ce426]|uniref:nucleoside 2-deoxyribosyltransferase domain-containing protein n=1 Tax=Sorangium sp. So ce426 TaxID=3133312 RepID=UPI003F5B8A17
MDVVRTGQPFPTTVTRAIFLAGPAPSDARRPSWRSEVLRLLVERGYDGAVFVPEPCDGMAPGPDGDPRAWEHEGLRRADCILFWVPRRLDTKSTLITHVDLGAWLDSGKVVLGVPDDPELHYLRQLTDGAQVAAAPTLAAAVDSALARVGAGAARRRGECQIPADIFRTPAFQSWYGAQQAAGNILTGATVKWVFRVGVRQQILYYALLVDIVVAAEKRHKKNEVVLARPDVAAVVLHHRGATPRETRVALVREFRSTATTADGYVRECPGGSSFEETDDMRRVAFDEVTEEVGLQLDASRVRLLGTRQLAATTSSHRAHVFSAELTASELDMLCASAGAVHGADADERTTIEIWTLEDLLQKPAVDWSTLGMIMAALAPGE